MSLNVGVCEWHSAARKYIFVKLLCRVRLVHCPILRGTLSVRPTLKNDVLGVSKSGYGQQLFWRELP
jgi:hypothetical protein